MPAKTRKPRPAPPRGWRELRKGERTAEGDKWMIRYLRPKSLVMWSVTHAGVIYKGDEPDTICVRKVIKPKPVLRRCRSCRVTLDRLCIYCAGTRYVEA